MAYRFKLDEPLAAGLRRIALEQIDQARSQLNGSTDDETGIHDIRKALKRVRALLRLVRHGIGQASFKRENARIRDLGRRFASRREIVVMQQTLLTLEGLNGSVASSGATRKVRALLAEAATSIERPVNADDLRGAFEEARRSLAALELQPATFEPLAEGLGESYRDCRRAFAETFSQTVQDEQLHEWRKTVQVHWRHMALLKSAWPELMLARARTARELAQVLGQDHDLFVLGSFLGGEKAAGVDRKAARTLIGACRKRQSALRKTAQLLGGRLTAEGPSGLCRRVTDYWAMSARQTGSRAAAARRHKTAASLR